MKKIIILIIIIFLALSVSACKKTNDTGTEQAQQTIEQTSPASETTITETTEAIETFKKSDLVLPDDILLRLPDSKTGLWGFVNNKGQFVIEPAYYNAMDFGDDENTAVYLSEEDMKEYNYKIIDRQGNLLSETETEEIKKKWQDFFEEIATSLNFASNGLAAKQDGNGKWGYVNESGQWVIEPKYEYAQKFSDTGLAAVRFYLENNKIFAHTAYIDENDNRITPPMLLTDFGEFASNGLAYVAVDVGTPAGTDIMYELYAYYYGLPSADFKSYEEYVNNMDKYPPINKGKNKMVDYYFSIESMDKFFDVYGYIDKTGNAVIPLRYIDAQTFNDNGYAFVQDIWTEGLWGVIDESGEYVVEPRFVTDPDDYTSENFAKNGYAKDVNGFYGFIDENGQYFIEPLFKKVNSFGDEDYAWVQDKNDMWGQIDKTGSYLIEPLYKDFQSATYENKIFLVQNQDGLWGYIDIEGKYVIGPK
jgi:hypothetical protein